LNGVSKKEHFVPFTKAGMNLKYRALTPMGSIEKILNGEIWPLTDDKEVEAIRKQHVDLQTSKDILAPAWSTNTVAHSRTYPLGYVLGSSGSGKSFFAVKEAASLRLPEDNSELRTTLYLLPKNALNANKKPILGENATLADLDLLTEWIKRRIEELSKKSLDRQLEMHVSIVVDEAPGLKGFFDNPTNVNHFLGLLKPLATTVFLIVVGTAVTADNYSSQGDVHKFRMRQWTSGDLVSVFDKIQSMAKGTVFGPEMMQQIVDAMLQQPTLNALSTNARSATFLLRAIYNLNKGTILPNSEMSWVVRLSYLTPAIVVQVVAEYMNQNGLSRLTTDAERRRVAASALHAVHYASKDPTVGEMPSFYGLVSDNETACARSLVTRNIEDGKFAVKEFPTALLMTPALVVVACSLLGVPVQILSNFKTQELITALYVLGKQAAQIVEVYRRTGAIKDLDQALEGLGISLLSTRVPLARKTWATLYVPIVGSTRIWMNGDGAPSADVIAPYEFYQCKHSKTKGLIYLDLRAELAKCFLLKSQQKRLEREALNGFAAVWKGSINPSTEAEGSKTKRRPAKTKADEIKGPEEPALPGVYPYHALDTPRVAEEIKYLQYRGEKGGEKSWFIHDRVPIEIGTTEGLRITFYISTNATRISLSGKIEGGENPRTWKGFRFSKDDVDDEGHMRVSELSRENPSSENLESSAASDDGNASDSNFSNESQWSELAPRVLDKDGFSESNENPLLNPGDLGVAEATQGRNVAETGSSTGASKKASFFSPAIDFVKRLARRRRNKLDATAVASKETAGQEPFSPQAVANEETAEQLGVAEATQGIRGLQIAGAAGRSHNVAETGGSAEANKETAEQEPLSPQDQWNLFVHSIDPMVDLRFLFTS
jgi:hypothetical protein